MEILTSVKRLYIRFKSLVNDFVYSFGRAALLLLVEMWNHAVPVRERRRIRVNTKATVRHFVCAVDLHVTVLQALDHLPRILLESSTEPHINRNCYLSTG